jgi:hypothetical protein
MPRQHDVRRRLLPPLLTIGVAGVGLAAGLILPRISTTCHAAPWCRNPGVAFGIVVLLVLTPLWVYVTVRWIRERPNALGVALAFSGVFFVLLAHLAYRIYQVIAASP